MQKLLSVSAALLLVTGMFGCQQRERPELAEVPPPMQDEAETFEPVAVEDYDEVPEPEEVEQPPREQQAEQPRSGEQGTRYTVRRGDTLWSIAQNHYGDGQRWRDIAEANPNINPNRLLEGQELTLP